MINFILVYHLVIAFVIVINQNEIPKAKIVNITEGGWASNSINTVIFRSNSLITHNGFQYIAYYDQDGVVVIAKRKSGMRGIQIYPTKFKGNVKDAHNCISIMVDGEGYIHMSWDQHGDTLRYCRSKSPEMPEFDNEIIMTGIKETNVTYPQFLRMQNGNLIFMYRDGESGRGNLIIDYFDTKQKTWINLHQNLIDGEGKRNAYWQSCTDEEGVIHLSWVWRESWDVKTNHDICYAKSTDGGKTWSNSKGKEYKIPITMKTAETILKIPQERELINQTSMYASEGKVYIATYWTTDNSKIPQYQLVFFDGKKWEVKQISNRKTEFSLSGGGTKRIPISRPLVIADEKNIYLISRDEERGSKVSVSICNDIKMNIWRTYDLTTTSVGMWEPTYDTELWKTEFKLNLFLQKVEQADAENLNNIPPQKISVLEWQMK